MTTYTQAELATRVLKDLGLVGADEVPSADDQEWAEETVGSEVALLNAVGIPVWGGAVSSVPEEYLTALSRRIGLAVAPSFGLTDLATATMAMLEVEKQLRRLTAKPSTGVVVSADYY